MYDRYKYRLDQRRVNWMLAAAQRGYKVFLKYPRSLAGSLFAKRARKSAKLMMGRSV